MIVRPPVFELPIKTASKSCSTERGDAESPGNVEGKNSGLYFSLVQIPLAENDCILRNVIIWDVLHAGGMMRAPVDNEIGGQLPTELKRRTVLQAGVTFSTLMSVGTFYHRGGLWMCLSERCYCKVCNFLSLLFVVVPLSFFHQKHVRGANYRFQNLRLSPRVDGMFQRSPSGVEPMYYMHPCYCNQVIFVFLYFFKVYFW